MNVSIIGTGNVGGALARTLSSAGHQIVVTSTTPGEAEVLANEVGGRSVRSNAEAIEAADIVIMAVPFDAIVQLRAGLSASRPRRSPTCPSTNFVAATDPAAKATVVDLVRSIGMRPIDAGPLDAARILEGMGALNIFLNMQGGTWQNAWKLVEPSG